MTLRAPCPRCGGLGWGWEVQCALGCPAVWLSEAEYTEPDLLLPCDHPPATAEERTCVRCDGRGEVGIEPELERLGLGAPQTLDEAYVALAALVDQIERLRETLDTAALIWARQYRRGSPS